MVCKILVAKKLVSNRPTEDLICTLRITPINLLILEPESVYFVELVNITHETLNKSK